VGSGERESDGSEEGARRRECEGGEREGGEIERKKKRVTI
jgi:hypothetical protein